MPALAVSYSGLLGGAERVLLDIATGLPERPLIACPPGPLADAARAGGLGVFALRERSLELRRSPRDRVAMPLRLAGQAAEVRALVRAQRPDALLAWGMRAGLVARIAYPRGDGPPLLFQHVDLLPGPQIARAVRAAARRAELVVACSRCIAGDLDPDGALGDRLVVVPLGVDLERFRPAEDRSAGDAPSAGESAGGAGEVLVLGAIEPWKRPELALEAAARVPGLRLRVVGAPIGVEGERLLAQLRERAARPDLAGRVEIAGAVGDPRAALQHADCLLHCAEREPYGMVVAEALASGLPVVVPSSCGPAEIADATCGRLYAPGDAAAAARALEEVLGDPRTAATMRLAARAHAEATLDLEDTRRRYAELIDAVASGRSHDRWTAPARTSLAITGAGPERTRASADRGPHGGSAAVAGVRPEPARAGSGAAPLGDDIAIVTVIHDSERELRALLDSAERHLPAAQVVVVDSGSTDGGAALARARGAQVVELDGNLGFGRGVNAGLTCVERRVAALLNPDVELLDASLAAAAAEAGAHPERLLAPQVLLPDGRRQDNAQREPGSALLALHALAPGRALPPRLAATVEPWRAAAPRRVGWAVGCAIVADAMTLRALGPFDERTFMYGEDLDLGLRASDAAIETWFWPAARVLHHGAHASERAFGGEPYDLLARRRRAVVRERRGAAHAAADDLLQAATFANRALLKRLAGRDATREREQLRALRVARGRERP
jgi:N-acetylglucosaminyl-diphospho-decaprenol L-rhamnosyltransferase